MFYVAVLVPRFRLRIRRKKYLGQGWIQSIYACMLACDGSGDHIGNQALHSIRISAVIVIAYFDTDLKDIFRIDGCYTPDCGSTIPYAQSPCSGVRKIWSSSSQAG
jgi:hypothetical protein